ncbi:hypothetical protein LTR37_006800 [Vermiconidia calcicola]|uniref:Uncharacterized protein n=1 Tax=Vermiconidia calcicola TaxID=1690605 RepID=A0ACC3NFC3_9PEZI|nr:hypothetical protein LTR37_006800 [Vermiconidia calcicola]
MSQAEKATPSHDVHTPDTSVDDTAVVLPQGWMYKSFSLFGKKLPWYASPDTQITMVAFVCFLCPGMFNALGGLGGGGLLNTRAANDSNTALYSTFAVVGFFAGTLTNRLGVNVAMGLGGLGYSVYVSAYLCYKFTESLGYVIFAGFLLGCCAGVLWSAQGVIMMSYPREQNKGRYIARFWIIFNLGGVIGALVPLGQNINTTVNTDVNNGTYIGFLVLTFCGALLAFTLVPGTKVVRADGSKVILMKNPTWKSEILGLWETFFTDPYILLLFPMFFSSNWFYTYQFNDVNAAKFNTRTRALNSVLYWSSQIVGAAIFGYLLDWTKFRRTTRARAAWAALFVLTFAIWGGGYAFQKGYTRAEVAAGLDTETLADDYQGYYDWTDSGYIGPMFLYMVYGLYDAIWQTCVYWYMGAITNNGRKLANFAGFYKGIQSAGAAIMWRLDGMGTPYMTMFASCWGLLAASLLIGLPVIYLKIEDTVSVEEDLKFSDETVDDVLAHQKHDGMA